MQNESNLRQATNEEIENYFKSGRGNVHVKFEMDPKYGLDRVYYFGPYWFLGKLMPEYSIIFNISKFKTDQNGDTFLDNEGQPFSQQDFLNLTS